MLTSGHVKRNTTITVRMGVRPKVKAKPRTCPTASPYRTAAAMKLTALPERIVRRALAQPRGTAARKLRPPRISYLLRSKNTTKESAVITIQMYRQTIPAKSTAKPSDRTDTNITANKLTPERNNETHN